MLTYSEGDTFHLREDRSLPEDGLKGGMALSWEKRQEGPLKAF